LGAPGVALPFSRELRTRTQDAHTAAEQADFIVRLMGGQLDVAAYAALLVELREVYATLEAAEDLVGDRPGLRAFLDPTLRRRAAILSDLDALGVPAGTAATCEATQRYRERIAFAATTLPISLVGHHYTRVLGDLAGGQIIAVMLQRHYGLAPEQLTFFRFDGETPKRRADRYRAELDAADLSPEEREAVIGESLHAYGCNAAIFAELGRRFSPLPA
jgi:heme oxygenase (biliverdin-producing, ferredoxin)